MDSAAPCAFDSESSAPSSEEDVRLWHEALEVLLVPTKEGRPASSSDPPPTESYYHVVGDVTVEDFLVDLDQGLTAPPPPPPPPPSPPGGGGLQLVAVGSLPSLGNGESANSSDSSANSMLQFGGDLSRDEIFMNPVSLPAAPAPAADDHIPVLPAPPPDDAQAGVVAMIGHAVPVASGGDDRELVGADSLVSGDSDGIGADAGSSSDSWEDVWCQILEAEGTSSTAMDDNFSGLPSPSAGRRWPVVAPGESIGVDVRPNGTWEAHLWLKDHNIERSAKPKNGHQFFVGSFGSEDEAKCAHDQAAIMLGVRVTKNGTLYSLNHPEERYAAHIAEHAGWSRRDYMWKMRRRSGKFSKGLCDLKGVAQRKAARWSASISVTTMIDDVRRKTTMAIGQFQTEDEAGREYDKALLFIKGAYDPGCITNFRPSTYSAEEVQAVGERLAAAYPKVNFQELRRKRSGVLA